VANLFLAGDTVAAPGLGSAVACASALSAARQIAEYLAA
jgi:hypothetical protein